MNTKKFIITFLFLLSLNILFSDGNVKMYFPMPNENYRGVISPVKSQFLLDPGSIKFTSEFGPRAPYKRSRASLIHQGLDMVSSGNTPFLPLFAVEEGEIWKIRWQDPENPESKKNIWEMDLKATGTGREKYIWEYMHIMTSIADVNDRKDKVRSYIFIKQDEKSQEDRDGKVVINGVELSDTLDNDSDINDFLKQIFGPLTAEESGSWIKYFGDYPNLGYLIKRSLGNIEIDGYRVKGVAIVDFDNDSYNDDNVLVFFRRDGGKFIPICGYGPRSGVEICKLSGEQEKYISSYLTPNDSLRVVNVRTKVSPGEIIALLGDSEEYSYHLHLALSESSKVAAAGGGSSAYGGSEYYHRGFIHPQIGFMDADDEYVKQKMGCLSAPDVNDLYKYEIKKLGPIQSDNKIYLENGASLRLDVFVRSWLKDIKEGVPPGLNSLEFKIRKKTLGFWGSYSPLYHKGSDGVQKRVRFTLFGNLLPGGVLGELYSKENDPTGNEIGIKLTRDNESKYFHAYYDSSGYLDNERQMSETEDGVYPTTKDPTASGFDGNSMGKERFVYNWNSSAYDNGEYEILVEAKDFQNITRAIASILRLTNEDVSHSSFIFIVGL